MLRANALFVSALRYMIAMRLWLLYALCAPWNCAVLVLSSLLWPLGLGRARRTLGVLWLDIRPGSWLTRHWGYSTTLGHVVVLQPGCAGGDTERHELVHVRQFEGAVCSVWLVALAGLAAASLANASLAGLVVVVLGPWWSYAGASLAAFLRGQRPYLDNHFERHARAEASFAELGSERARKA